MKKNRYLYILIYILPFLEPSLAFSINADSLFIENILEKSYTMDFSTSEEKLLFFAGAFQGKPYAGGTLDNVSEECLVVRTDSLDCTTFVETVVALFVSSKESSASYSDFCCSLRNIRYRDGIINGYTSRLHYFSDWVSDNTKKGLFSEVTEKSEHKIREFSLNYMTANKEAYRHLNSNAENIDAMKNIEMNWKNYKMSYIPKDLLDQGRSSLAIDNGDIIALTTSIEGLDVVHLGFAFWIKDKLHLLHASSLHHKIMLDEESLYDYLMKRKKHTGIRVVRIF